MSISEEQIIQALRVKLGQEPGKIVSITQEENQEKPHIKSIKITLENSSKIDLIAKCLTKEFESNEKTVQNFQVESYMYKNVLLSKKLNVPKAYFVSEKEQLILMENCLENGYQVRKPFEKPFSKNEVKGVMKTLAQFHSETKKYLKNQDVEKVRKILQKTSWMVRLPNTIQVMKIMVQGAFEISGLKIDPDDFMEKIINLQNSQGLLETIVQDNLWYGQLLFKSDNCILLDFKMSRVSNPFFDVVNFMALNLQYDLRKDWKEFLTCYYSEFTKNYDLEPLTCADFVAEYKKVFKMGFLSGIQQLHVSNQDLFLTRSR